MSRDKSLISDVTDTARLVAAYRAIESDRPDALFTDPLARALAGEDGFAMTRAQPIARSGWWMTARTKLIDDLVLAALDEGCDRVVNLAAGLDTRPYRLNVPGWLEWVEVDHAQLLADKQQALRQEAPRCRVRRLGADLSDDLDRRRALDAALEGSAAAFVLTEGLLMYLSFPEVAAVSEDLERAEIARWVLDVASAGLVKTTAKRTVKTLRHAPARFGPVDGVAYFEALGWTVSSVQSVLTAADRFGRLSWPMRLVAKLPQPDSRHPGKKPWYAVTCLTHGSDDL